VHLILSYEVEDSLKRAAEGGFECPGYLHRIVSLLSIN
jgi:hypothetical protein